MIKKGDLKMDKKIKIDSIEQNRCDGSHPIGIMKIV